MLTGIALLVVVVGILFVIRWLDNREKETKRLEMQVYQAEMAIKYPIKPQGDETQKEHYSQPTPSTPQPPVLPATAPVKTNKNDPYGVLYDDEL